MRSLLSCVLLAVLSLGATTVAWCDESEETFPYVAYVAADTARIHAGPGNAYYATDELTRGMKVEVYQSISGWLAIGPPVNSFCWVPAKDAELTDEPDIAMILTDDVPAWIGTRVDREAEHLWQVQLNQGDHVKILDVKRRPSAAGKAAESWYRIEPPEGELRFIRAEDVSSEEVTAEEPEVLAEETPASEADTEPKELPAAVAEASPIETQPETAAPEETTTADNVEAAEAEEPSVLKAQFTARARREARAAKAAVSQPTKTANRESASPFKDLGESATTPRVASLDRLPATNPDLLLTASSRFEDRIADLELELSLMAARDVREWKLDPLRTQAEQLVNSGKTTLERGRARLLADKIGEFDALYLKAIEIPQSTPRTAGITPVGTSAADISEQPAPRAKAETLKVPDGVSYDGVGWLKPVYSAKRIAPPYALVDVDGKVLQYVTPAPGLNLNRYVKKPVGIFGQRSHLSEFNAAHVTAAKVVDLSKYQDD